MSSEDKRKAAMTPRTSRAKLAEEAAAWSEGRLTPQGWEDAPSAVPRAAASKAISIRLPVPMLQLLRGFAERDGIGYQVLIKRWLDDRLRTERRRLRSRSGEGPLMQVVGLAPVFPMEDMREAPYRTGTGG